MPDNKIENCNFKILWVGLLLRCWSLWIDTSRLTAAVTNIRGQIQPLSASPQVKSWEETVAESHAGGGLNALIVDIKR